VKIADPHILATIFLENPKLFEISTSYLKLSIMNLPTKADRRGGLVL